MYCLVSWPGEDSVSVVPRSSLLGVANVGTECQVKMGRAKYVGELIAIGMLF